MVASPPWAAPGTDPAGDTARVAVGRGQEGIAPAWGWPLP